MVKGGGGLRGRRCEGKKKEEKNEQPEEEEKQSEEDDHKGAVFPLRPVKAAINFLRRRHK